MLLFQMHLRDSNSELSEGAAFNTDHRALAYFTIRITALAIS